MVPMTVEELAVQADTTEKQLREMMRVGREMADQLTTLTGGEIPVERPSVDELTPAQIVTELHAFLMATHAQFGPALDQPMVKTLLGMLSKRKG